MNNQMICLTCRVPMEHRTEGVATCLECDHFRCDTTQHCMSCNKELTEEDVAYLGLLCPACYLEELQDCAGLE